MAAITYTTADQNQIALRVWNRLYANLSTEQKTAVDGAATPPTVTSGHVFDVLAQVGRYSNFVQMAGSAAGDVDDAWRGWVLWETVARCSYHQSTDRYKEARAQSLDCMRQALSTYSRSDADDEANTEGWVVNHLNLRRHILGVAVRLEPMLLPTPEFIAATMRSVYVRVWNMADWWWKRRQVTFTVNTSSVVTNNLSGSEVMHSIASERLFYDDADNPGGEMYHVGAAEMARELALGYTAGRPIKYRTYRTSAGLQWVFDRTPDQSYTFRGEVLLAQPALATAANFTTALGLLPAEQLEALRDLTTASVIAGLRHPAGPAMLAESEARWAPWIEKAQDIGEPDTLPMESQTRATFTEMFNQSGGGYGALLGGNL